MPERQAVKETVLTAGTLAFAVALQLAVFVSSGPLWRDEAWSATQALLPGWAELRKSLQWDTFPPLYPTLLHLLHQAGLAGNDCSLRVTGLLISAAFIAVLLGVSRSAGRTAGAVVLLFVAANPVLTWEIAAVRPYGLALLGVLGAWILIARCLECPSPSRVAAASFASVLAVQISYVNSFSVAAIGLAAVSTTISRHGRRAAVLLIPAGAAALSLLPYMGILSAARDWTVLFRNDPEWLSFLRRSTAEYGWPLAVLWIAAIALLPWKPVRLRGDGPVVAVFAGRAAAISLAIQVSLVHAAGLPLFLRYFLPVLLMAGLALGFRFGRLSFNARAALVLLGVAATAGQAWQFITQRRTNADLVAAYLNRAAVRADLVLISPWFLHPSFSRYYRGQPDWCTIPDVGHGPGVRYDRIRDLMTGRTPDVDVGVRISETLGRGGTVWLVSQRYPSDSVPPRRPAQVAPGVLDGSRYSEFRSYWERNVECRLLHLASGTEIPISAARDIWREERLVLSRWEGRAK